MPRAAACAMMPARSSRPSRSMVSTARSARSARIVATAAAIGTAENQNEPVTKIRLAPSRYALLPSTAASG